MDAVLIPIKRLAQAKSRLAALLEPAQRQALVLAMLTHVTTVVRSAADHTTVALVSNEPTGAALAQRCGVELIADTVGELNPALSAARLVMARRGVTRLVVLAADLPLLTVDDVTALFAGLSAADVVIAPDQLGLGTNALALRLPQALALPFRFGTASAGPHAQAAQQLGLAVAFRRSATLALDIDDGAALAQLNGTRTDPDGNGILARDGVRGDGGEA